MIEISKELFNEVMKNVGDIYNMKVVNDYLFWDNGYSNQINIYELAYKCKKWAYTKCNYTLESTSNPFGGFCKIKIYEIDIGKAYNISDDVYRGTNEVEAIIKACQWILDNTKES